MIKFMAFDKFMGKTNEQFDINFLLICNWFRNYLKNLFRKFKIWFLFKMLTIFWEIPFTILNSFKTQIYDKKNHIDMKLNKQKRTHNIFLISYLQINWLFWNYLVSIFQKKSIFFSLHKVFPLRIFSEKFNQFQEILLVFLLKDFF
jgi:hypothetical protein